jgi:hypothetical protein
LFDDFIFREHAAQRVHIVRATYKHDIRTASFQQALYLVLQQGLAGNTPLVFIAQRPKTSGSAGDNKEGSHRKSHRLYRKPSKREA